MTISSVGKWFRDNEILRRLPNLHGLSQLLYILNLPLLDADSRRVLSFVLGNQH